MDIESATIMFSDGFAALADEVAHREFDIAVRAAVAMVAQIDKPVVIAQGVVGGTEVYVRAEAQPMRGGPARIMYMTMRERIRDEMEWYLEMPVAALALMDRAEADDEGVWLVPPPLSNP